MMSDCQWVGPEDLGISLAKVLIVTMIIMMMKIKLMKVQLRACNAHKECLAEYKIQNRNSLLTLDLSSASITNMFMNDVTDYIFWLIFIIQQDEAFYIMDTIVRDRQDCYVVCDSRVI